MTGSRIPLAEDIRTGWWYAAAFSALAVLIVLVAAIFNALGLSRVNDVGQLLPIGLPLVIFGYFAGGTLGGIAFWVLRLLGQSLIAWMLRGFVIAALVYGAIGLTGIIGFYVGANLLDLESAAEGWRLLPLIGAITGVFPGTLLGVYYWHRQRRGA